MSTLKFADTHNMVAFLSKPTESEGFEQIVDFLNAHPINAKTTALNEFSSTMASAVIRLATNQRFNFSKYIFESMVKNSDNEGKFLMYPRFVQVFLDKQVDGMATQAEIGEGLAIPTDPYPTPIIIPSTSQPPKKQRSRKPKRRDTEIPQSSVLSDYVADKAVNEEMDDSLERATTTATSLYAEQDRGGGPRRQDTIGDTIAQTRFENVSKTSNDPLLLRGNTHRSGEGSMQLNEFIELCINSQNRVINLENKKTTQAQEITSLKKRVKRLEKKNRSRTNKLKRLYKVGRSARVISSDEASLGDQEDVSKQGRIADIDAHEDIYLVNVHRDKDIFGVNDQDNADMFDVNTLIGDEVIVESEVAAKKKDDEVNVVKEVVSAAEETVNAATITEDEITLAQALAELKSVKPKVTTATRATTKGILLQEPSESITITITTTIPSKDKGKGSEACKGKNEANVALIEEWNDIQAKIYVDYQMAKQMQVEEQEELSIEEKSKLFVQLLEARKKHFAAKRVEEKRNMPPTRAQQRSIMSMKRVNTFVDMDTELVEGSEVRAEGSKTRVKDSSKRAGDELEQENAKKQKMNDEQETAELQSLIEIVSDEEGIAINDIPLATKPLSIVDWKILKEGKISYYQIIRADGSSKRYSAFIQMLRSFDIEDLETLWKLVKAKNGSTRPEEGYERVLLGDLKTMFEPNVEDEV
ncbi:hypothetical protein Tco_0129265 [Tanacetum coccineum]